jgi:hypothetical protein
LNSKKIKPKVESRGILCFDIPKEVNENWVKCVKELAKIFRAEEK